MAMTSNIKVQESVAVSESEVGYKTIIRQITSRADELPGSWAAADFDAYVTGFMKAGWKVAASNLSTVESRRNELTSQDIRVFTVFVTLVKGA